MVFDGTAVDLEKPFDELFGIQVAVLVRVQEVEETLRQKSRQLGVLKGSRRGITHLNKCLLVYAFVRPIGEASQVLELI